MQTELQTAITTEVTTTLTTELHTESTPEVPAEWQPMDPPASALVGSFGETYFRAAKLGDKRLTDRLVKVALHAGKVLVLHDTTELDFTGHKSLRDTGQIGNGSRRGWLCLHALVVSPQTREVLGLAGQILEARSTVPKGEIGGGQTLACGPRESQVAGGDTGVAVRIVTRCFPRLCPLSPQSVSISGKTPLGARAGVAW